MMANDLEYKAYNVSYNDTWLHNVDTTVHPIVMFCWFRRLIRKNNRHVFVVTMISVQGSSKAVIEPCMKVDIEPHEEYIRTS